MSASNPITSRCTARSKRTGAQCQQWVLGGGVCRAHGGAAPQVKAAQVARVVDLEAQQRAGLDHQRSPSRRPADVLLDAVGASDQVMQSLKRDIEAGMITTELIATYGAWLDRAGRLSKLAIDANLDSAQDRAVEQAAQVVAATIMRILDRLALSADQQETAARVVPDVLRSLGEHGGGLLIEGDVVTDEPVQP